jgi:uncharacterized linocin/CFP29 family protein
MLTIENKQKLSLARPFVRNGKSYVTMLRNGANPADKKSYITKEIQANATLRPEDWKQLDDVIIRTARNELIGINDLRSAGLTYNLKNALGTMILESNTVSDSMQAILSMNGIVRGQNDRPEFDKQGTPLPLLHSDYEIQTRSLEASKKSSTPLDTESAALAAKALSERLETMLFGSWSYLYGGYSAYSYLTYPNRNQLTLAESWQTASHAAITRNILDMKQQLSDLSFHAPKMVYIPANWQPRLDEYYNVEKEQTLYERILQVAGIRDIKPTPYLANDNAVMVQMTSDVVRLIDGLPITNVQDVGEGGFLNSYKIYTICVPEVRSDIRGNTGLVHLA